MPLLEVIDLVKTFPAGDAPTLDRVRFRVEPGEIFGLLGPSGCGKTTTLRVIAGFESADAGSVLLRGRDISALEPERRSMGMIFQDYALFPHLTVRKNIRFALKGRPSAGRERRIGELMATFGLSTLGDRYPHELSGGQQQRVAIARALAAEPAILLMDEPFSNLDAALRDATRREIRATLKAAGVNAILVTHDQEEALSFCDRLAVMNGGRIEQEGKPEEVYFRPRTSFVAGFLGKANLIRGRASGDTAETELGRIPIVPARRGDVLLSLRPEHVALRPRSTAAGAAPALVAEVVSREFKGHDSTYRFRCGERIYLSHMEYARNFAPGELVEVEVREPGVALD